VTDQLVTVFSFPGSIHLSPKLFISLQSIQIFIHYLILNHMAITQNPIIGKAKQKFANAVFSGQFGKNTMRSKPFSVKNPRTEGQVLTRDRMRLLGSLLKQVKSSINQAYRSSIKGMSPINHVVGVNMKHAFDGDTATIVPAQFVICDNDGPRPESFVITAPVAGTAHVVYTADPQTPAEGALDMTFFFFNPAAGKLRKCATTCLYSAQVVDLLIPGQSGALLHIYSCTPDTLNPLNGRPRQIFTYCGSVQML
jgi:hypothetical protein